MDTSQFNQGLLSFIKDSPTPFHAVESVCALTSAADFHILEEAETWKLESGKRYVVKRSGSVIAFKIGSSSVLSTGIHLVGAHTDSPCIKIKPRAEIQTKAGLQLGVEVYGGALLNPWFDRDLSIAGQLTYLTDDQKLKSCLIDIKKPVAIIPSLAIHLDREANLNRSINSQKHLPALLLQLEGTAGFNLDDFLLKYIQEQNGCREAIKVMSHELCLYDTQVPALVGLQEQFIASARLDNLLSCYLATVALIQSNCEFTSLVVCNDHEEVGSNSLSGAQGTFLRSVIQRIVARESKESDALERVYRKSMLLSIDNAHGIHPNFPDQHDPQHGPVLNSGPVIKVNANQRYASNNQSVAQFRHFCEKAGVTAQSFVMRSDLACGSTIGPITATNTGISTVDIGVPTLAMHSIRELAGANDAQQLNKVVTCFFNR